MNNVILSLEQHAEQWIKIAGLLEIPDYVISSIQVSRLQNDKASLRRVVEWWFKNTHNPEWNAIQDVLIKG